MKNIKKATDAIREELKEPLPDHQPEKEKKMATKKKSKKKASKKVTKRVAKKKGCKKVTKKVAKKGADGVTLAELAKDAGISGQKARQKLRAAGIEREKGSRWVFTGKADLKAARKALGL
jgi:hypothetical protein